MPATHLGARFAGERDAHTVAPTEWRCTGAPTGQRLTSGVKGSPSTVPATFTRPRVPKISAESGNCTHVQVSPSRTFPRTAVNVMSNGPAVSAMVPPV